MPCWDDYRHLFPVTNNYIFFNHAGVAPISVRVEEKLREFLTDALQHGSVNSEVWQAKAEEIRLAFARLIKATPEEVAFVKNTSEGLSLVANGLDFKPGDNVVIPAIEFPANVYPWLNLGRAGVETRMVAAREGRIELEDIYRAVDEKTRLISISSVEYSNGFRNNLEALGQFCHNQGIFLCVDAIQSLGVFPMDVGRYQIDFLSADGHKWLLSPEGAGGFFCSKRALARLHPAKVGWKSVKGAHDFSRINFTLKEDAGKFEEGSLNLMSITALGASLELLLSIGIEAIEARVLELTDHLICGLKGLGFKVISSLMPEERSGIVSFLGKEEAEALCLKLRSQKIIVSVRNGWLRVSPHFYNTHEEVETFLKALSQLS